MKYNFELIFKKDVQDKIQVYTDKINNVLNAEYKLKENPHITLVKFETDEELSKEYREEISAKFEELEIEFSGLKLLPSKGGGTWIEISVLQSENLRQLVRKFCDLFPNIKILSPGENRFRPHLTICKLKDKTEINIAELSYDLLRSKVKAKPRLFIAGEIF